MLKIVLAGIVAVPAAGLAAVAATGVAVVDVQEARGGHHIVVPVPLALAQAAALFVPEHRTRLQLDRQAERYLPAAREALAALSETKDAELVRVEEPGRQVSIRKEGEVLRVHVEEGDQRVDVGVPISLALSVLPESGGRITPSRAVWALQRARFTQVVDVHGRDGERVKVTVY